MASDNLMPRAARGAVTFESIVSLMDMDLQQVFLESRHDSLLELVRDLSWNQQQAARKKTVDPEVLDRIAPRLPCKDNVLLCLQAMIEDRSNQGRDTDKPGRALLLESKSRSELSREEWRERSRLRDELGHWPQDMIEFAPLRGNTSTRLAPCCGRVLSDKKCPQPFATHHLTRCSEDCYLCGQPLVKPLREAAAAAAAQAARAAFEARRAAATALCVAAGKRRRKRRMVAQPGAPKKKPRRRATPHAARPQPQRLERSFAFYDAPGQDYL